MRWDLFVAEGLDWVDSRTAPCRIQAREYPDSESDGDGDTNPVEWVGHRPACECDTEIADAESLATLAGWLEAGLTDRQPTGVD